MFVKFGDGGCFHFEHINGNFNRQWEMYQHLKEQFEKKEKMRQYEDRYSRDRHFHMTKAMPMGISRKPGP